jgi:transcriptional regulator with XRE-family HTH domain
MTQARLAEASNLGEEWIRRIERGVGAPSFDAVEGLARGLGASVAELFAPMSARDGRTTTIEAILAKLDEHELAWLEGVIRAAINHPSRQPA